MTSCAISQNAPIDASAVINLRVTAKMSTAFRRVLVANRGEIAVRIIRACRELGLETVQVFSEADRESLPVRLANRAVCIGPPPASRSYLNGEFIVSAALTHGADAIHPGYGFLSENARFAAMCEKEGIAFIGPSSDVMALMGDKSTARRIAAEAGVPTVPGSNGPVSDVAEAKAVAKQVGYPAMLKASGGAIVNISSIAAVVGIPLTAAYSTTKGGLDALTRCLAIDYAKQGIRCNGVCVGLIDTPMAAPLLSDPVRTAQVLTAYPLGRPGTPDEVARLVLYLASDESAWVTGAIYPIDGGMTAQ